MAKRPGGVMVQGTEPTRSQLIPVITKWNELGKTAQLGPVLFCIAVFFSMVTFGSTNTIEYAITSADGKVWLDPREWIYTSNFLIILAVFLTMVSLYFIYRMIGKNKSWYILLGAAGFTAYYLWLFRVDHYFGWMYDFFHLHLAGGEPDNSAPFIQLFIQHFLGTGFFEEIVKALPIFALVIAGSYMTPEMRKKIGVEEPLDGILIGAASGGGFAVMETLLQYVPADLVNRWTTTKYRSRPGCHEFRSAKSPHSTRQQRFRDSSGNQVAHYPIHRPVLRPHGLRRLLRILHRALGDQAGATLEDTNDWPGFGLHPARAVGHRAQHGHRATGSSDRTAIVCRARCGCAQGARDIAQPQPSATERNLWWKQSLCARGGECSRGCLRCAHPKCSCGAECPRGKLRCADPKCSCSGLHPGCECSYPCPGGAGSGRGATTTSCRRW
jgi:RsiW-degrading membrane proteinase PrsW (M82 family)